MYRIRFRPDLNLLDIAWTGMFTDGEVAAYARELRKQFIAQGFREGYRLRMDMSESAVQPQEAVMAFGRHLGDFPRACRIAIVTPSAVTRLQVRRVMTQPYLRIFDRAVPALEWLMRGETVVAAALTA